MAVKNFNTKLNLIQYLLQDKQEYTKVILFISTKKNADVVFEMLENEFGSEVCIIHSNKSQNYRARSVAEFEAGEKRIIVATDVMARGLDFEKVSHVISFDVPEYPENYMHRIGRTGRADESGISLMFYTENETANKEAIEKMMSLTIEEVAFPEEVDVNPALTEEERPKSRQKNLSNLTKQPDSNPGAHEKKDKNKKVNLGGSYKRKIAEKYSKPQTKGDKFSTKKKK
jgi:ATP-dependent RNA helicase RhlE